MKLDAIFVAALFMIFPPLSLAADEPSFEGGQKEVIAFLTAPNFETTVNLEIPADYYVTNVTMNVTGMAADGNSSAYPEMVSIRINDSTIWAFQNVGFGSLGLQEWFSAGKKQAASSFKSNGSSKTHYIRLPKDAFVQGATMDVRGSIPATGYTFINDIGNAASDCYGYSVSTAGDVNGDGYDDVIAGCDNSDYVNLYYGGQSIDNTTDMTFLGEGLEDLFGDSVSDAGDVNNDGYGDIIIGAWRNGAGGASAGRAYIYFGGNNMNNVADVVMTGLSAGNRFGMSVSNAGDLNRDGCDDVIVGADCANGGLGAAYIFFGGQNMDNAADVTLTGDSATSAFGRIVSDGGDINGDGYDDAIVGGTNTAGEIWAHIYFGGQNMDNKVDVILKISGGTAFPPAVSGAGDVNNDGYADVIMGLENNQSGGDHAGCVNLFYGGPSMDTTADVTIIGANAGDRLGRSVSDAGDVNNDGYDDVIIGAYGAGGYTNGSQNGEAYVLFGGNPMDNVSDYNFSEPTGGNLGISVSTAGDMNGDGYFDLMAGAPEDDSGGISAGLIFVFTCHVSNLTGILNPGIAIGSKSIWKGTGYFNGTALVSDFSEELNSYLAAALISGRDSYENAYVDVPVCVNASCEGMLSLFNLTVKYRYDASVPDFTSKLEDYLTARQNEKDANGNIKVPIKMHAQSAGRIKLSGLDIDISPDLPPAMVERISDAEIFEEGWNTTFIDLHPHFQDDLDPDSMLNFSVVSSTNSTYVRLWISGKRYLSIDAWTGDANDNWTGTVEAVVSCSDHWGHRTESNQFTIVVRNVNDEPIITSTPLFNAEAGVPYRYNVTAVDGDNDTLKFNLPKAPVGMTIDATTGKIQWLPRASGTHNVTVNVSDGAASAEQRFAIFVPNEGPHITSQPIINGSTGVVYTYNVTAEDDNLDNLKFSLSSSILGMAIDSLNGTIVWTPTYANDYDVVVVVSDGNLNATQEFSVKVLQGNRAPKFVSIPIKTATAGVPYTYLARTMDEDNDGLSVSLVVCPTGMAFDSVSGEVRWTPAAAGNFSVILKVADGKGGDALQEFVINVLDRVKAKVVIDRPSDNEKIRGKLTVSGTATKGTLDVVSANVRIDGGDWTDAAGNYTWQYSLDTTKLKNGKHLLEARAFDGKDYSDLAAVNFTVDNQKAQGKGFIPGFEIGLLFVALMIVVYLHVGRQRKNGGDFE